MSATRIARVTGAIERAQAEQPRLNALITLDQAGALKAAACAPSGVLEDLVIAHKDLFCTAGLRTTAGSKMLAEFVPPYSATVVERLQAAGAISIGKANMDEFAFGSSNEHSYFGAVRNPWDLERVPGGSSGGSAALVAAGVVDAATASDTGGSIRQPAAFCGVTGIKPTYGRVSRYGMVAFASSLDQGGVIARSSHTCARVLEVMCGADGRDATCVERQDAQFLPSDGRLDGVRVGVLRSWLEMLGATPIGQAVSQVARELEGLGAELIDVELSTSALAIPCYYVIAAAEASSNLSRYDGLRFGHRAQGAHDLDTLYRHSRTQGFGAEARRRIMLGTFVLSSGYYDAYYNQALRARAAIRADFAKALERVEVLLAPVTPGVAFKLGEKLNDPLAMYQADVMTVGVSLAGLPALSMPAGLCDGLPVGAQLIGKPWAEARILEVAHRFQQVTEHHLLRPAGVAQ